MITTLKNIILAAALLMSEYPPNMEGKIPPNMENNDTHETEQNSDTHVHHIQLFHDVEASFEYYKILTTLENADNGDLVCFYIDSNGGYVYIMEEILEAMNESEATIVTINMRKAYSAAGIILFNGDYIEFRDESWLMVHLIRYSKGYETIIPPVWDKYQKYFIEHHLSLIEPYLSYAEYYNVLNKQDVFIEADTIIPKLGDRHVNAGKCDLY